jgi:hypothetical protein
MGVNTDMKHRKYPRDVRQAVRTGWYLVDLSDISCSWTVISSRIAAQSTGRYLLSYGRASAAFETQRDAVWFEMSLQ